MSFLGRMTRAGLALGLAGLTLLGAPSAEAAESHALIQGSGSSWSANAINQWVADVRANGLRVVYTANGAAQGRKDFSYRTTDFGVSEIGFQGVDPVTGVADSANGRGYAYLPIIGGGTAFPYQIQVSGKLVRNLRLSGETIAKIFTNQITNWNDPAIAADNNGRRLPSLAIIPVVHSEGSGSSEKLSRYFDTLYPSIWRGYNGRAGFTEYYPRKGQMISQSGSDGVMNFIASKAANGSIGYVEYSYALAKNYPVVKVRNAAGYYTLPNQYNVAVALTQARINMDKSSPNYLLQNLDKVYTYKDARTYALSSYSYMIIPTGSDDQRMTTAKRQTLADFLYYSVCEGQREMGPIGYSPLPINLVQASFEQVNKLKTADSAVDISKRNVSTCHNPTFIAGQPKRNYLAEIAPKPPACDKQGSGPCTENGVPASSSSGGSGGGGNGGGSGNGGGGSGSSGSSGGASGSGAQGGGGATTDPGVTPVVDPTTGEVIVAAGSEGGGAVAVPVDLASYQRHGRATVLVPVAVLVLLLALVLPPALYLRMSGRAEAGP